MKRIPPILLTEMLYSTTPNHIQVWIIMLMKICGF